MKKKVFIGSSTEELKLAEAARDFLSKEFDVVIWNYPIWDQGVFKLNSNFLNDLLKATLLFDYVLMIGTRDDKVEYRGKEVFAARDNVIFELGLFLGRMGTSRCVFLIDWELNIPTDLKGISLAGFKRDDNSGFMQSLKSVEHFFKTSTHPEVNFFPSSTLASVYFQNFILPVCSYHARNSGFNLDGKVFENCMVNIAIPDQIDTDVNIQFEKLKKKVKTVPLSFSYDGRPRQVHVDARSTDGKLEIIDFPTIISGINYAIMQLLPDDYNKHSEDYLRILARELEKFCDTLLVLSRKAGFSDMVCLKKFEELD